MQQTHRRWYSSDSRLGDGRKITFITPPLVRELPATLARVVIPEESEELRTQCSMQRN